MDGQVIRKRKRRRTAAATPPPRRTRGAASVANERYRAISELASDWAYAFRVEPDGRLVHEWVTDAFRRVTGYAEGEIDARGGWRALIHPDDLPQALVQNQRLLAGHADVTEFRIVTKQGAVRWIRNHCRPVWNDAAGRTVRIYGAAQDITELKRSIAELVEWKDRYEAAVRASGHILYDWNAGTNEVTFAGDYERILGYTPADVPRQLDDALSMTHPDDLARFEREVSRVRRTREPFRLEYRVRCKDGRYICVEDRGYFVTDSTGALHMVGFLIDTTEQRRAEEEKAVLLEVARDITGTLDLDELLDRVQRRTAEVLPCETVATFYFHPTEQAFRIVSHHGVPPDLIAAATALKFSYGELFGGRLTGGQTIVINDFREQPWLPATIYERFHLAALVAVPLHVRGRMLGSLVAFTQTSGRRFAPDQVQLCESIGRQLAVAIEASELYRAQQDEAEVAGALARVGRELISSLSAPVLQERLCRLTTEVLGCDYSHALIWEPEEGVFSAASAYGYTSEDWESLRLVKVPRSVIAPFLHRLERDGFVQTASERSDLLPPAVPRASRTLHVALRRGDEIVGILTAEYRDRTDPFTTRQERISRGIAQLASLALENARLVAALEHANRLKADFVATMSHELRSPLHVIIGYNDLLLDEMFGHLTEAQAETLQRIRQRSHELLDLVNTTLDLSRLEAGRVPLDLRPVRLEQLIEELDAETRVVRVKPGVNFEWVSAPDLPSVLSDPLKLRVIVKNLVVNALKFTDAGSVTVTTQRREDGVEIAVRDTGIGIEPAVQPFIFEPFRQADSAHARGAGGVGLGLYIVRRLLDLLGGNVTFESEPGRGSCFRVWIPRTYSAAGAARQLTRERTLSPN